MLEGLTVWKVENREKGNKDEGESQWDYLATLKQHHFHCLKKSTCINSNTKGYTWTHGITNHTLTCPVNSHVGS